MFQEAYDIRGKQLRSTGCEREQCSKTILVVEDEEPLLGLVQFLLQDAGYKVMVARDGKEAVNAYAERPGNIDLVLSDMGLPGLGGREELIALRQINPDAKVLLSSGYFEPALKSAMLKEGARDFIVKPYGAKDLLQKVQEILDSDQYH